MITQSKNFTLVFNYKATCLLWPRNALLTEHSGGHGGDLRVEGAAADAVGAGRLDAGRSAGVGRARDDEPVAVARVGSHRTHHRGDLVLACGLPAQTE
jgi:hypothetical protein